MATVTGLTAARMLEIEAQSIVDGDVVGDDLILVRHDGTQINAGSVRGPSGSIPITNKLISDPPGSYPVGVSNFSVSASDVGWPSTLGTVTTFFVSTSRAFQIYAENATGQAWVRTAGDNDWSPWFSLTGTPVGSINMFAGTETPVGFLICDGSAISRTTYARLFAVLGTTYGVGDGSTTFNLPNLKGRVPVGQDATQPEFDALGETGGAKTHTLSAAEMPVHTHTQNSHTHTQNSHTHTNANHNHTQTGHDHSQSAHNHGAPSGSTGYLSYLSGNSGRTRVSTGTASDRVALTGVATTDIPLVTVTGDATQNSLTQTAVNQAAAITNDSTTPTNVAATATNQNAGSGGAHNNLQPYIVLNYIIKT